MRQRGIEVQDEPVRGRGALRRAMKTVDERSEPFFFNQSYKSFISFLNLSLMQIYLSQVSMSQVTIVSEFGVGSEQIAMKIFDVKYHTDR